MLLKIKRRIGPSLIEITIPVLGVILACMVGAVIITIMGYSASDAYLALLKGSLGSWSAVTVTISRAVPLILIGLAVAVARSVGVFNIGGGGQLMMGAITAVVVGHYVTGLPHILHIVLTLGASMVAGMLWILIPALLHSNKNINIVFTTIMFNYIANFFLLYCVNGPLKDPTSESSVLVQNTARLTNLVNAPGIMNTGIIIIAVVFVIITIFLYKTVFGYEIRAVGKNISAAISAGIKQNETIFIALLLSGLLAGLCGGIDITGQLGRLYLSYNPNYGFTGITVCLLARNKPLGIIIAGLLFGILYNGATRMQSSIGLPSDLIEIIQGLIIIFICLEYLFRNILDNMKRKGDKVNA